MVVGVVGNNDPEGAPPLGAQEPPPGEGGENWAVIGPPRFAQALGTVQLTCPPIQPLPYVVTFPPLQSAPDGGPHVHDVHARSSV
jgi:hypothetical protein